MEQAMTLSDRTRAGVVLTHAKPTESMDDFRASASLSTGSWAPEASSAEPGQVPDGPSSDPPGCLVPALADPIRAGVPQVGLERQPRGHASPARCAGSMTVQGRWQIEATRLPASKNASRTGLVEIHIDRELFTPIGEVPAADSFVLRRHDAGVRSGLVEGLLGFDQLDLVEAIRDEDGDLQSFEILISLAMFLLPYAAFLKLPWGSMANFLAAPLSKSL
jgi:hypothetical protein